MNLLPQQIDELIGSARKAAANAYCRYSKFAVGAAVMTCDGTLFSGCNVENASYGLTICAERVAITQAVSKGHRSLAAIAIVGGTDSPACPCGACLQVMAEFCERHMPVYLASLEGKEIQSLKFNELLPFAFDLSEQN